MMKKGNYQKRGVVLGVIATGGTRTFQEIYEAVALYARESLFRYVKRLQKIGAVEITKDYRLLIRATPKMQQLIVYLGYNPIAIEHIGREQWAVYERRMSKAI